VTINAVAAERRELTIELTGEAVVLMPERALYWHRARTLLVADPHFGKAATFRAGGIFVPRGTTSHAVRRLDDAIDRTGAMRVVFLGDLLHATEGRSPETLRVVSDWRATRSSVEMILVRGNHDRSAGDPPESLGITCVDAPLVDGPFAFTHHPKVIDGSYVLAGHVHPGVRLRGRGRQHERLPCFWIGERAAVLPAFGDFTGLGEIDLVETDRVFAVAGGAVIEVQGLARGQDNG
jgi:DNA ligase-associated metallophosphoesterase